MIPVWPCAHGGPIATGRIRVETDDFQVDEQLGFAPDGDGEHWLLQVEKRDANTHWVAGQLARCTGVAACDVSYSDLKDRRAVAHQWFSVHDPKRRSLNWSDASCDEFSVIVAERHRRKLRRGSHRANRFRIRIRDLCETGDLEERLDSVARLSVPNYFGEQRFGRGGANIGKALAMFGKVGAVDAACRLHVGHHRRDILAARGVISVGQVPKAVRQVACNATTPKIRLGVGALDWFAVVPNRTGARKLFGRVCSLFGLGLSLCAFINLECARAQT